MTGGEGRNAPISLHTAGFAVLSHRHIVSWPPVMSMTSNTLKPSYNPLLWAQLRPSMRPGVSDSSSSVTSIIPLLPENKTNTSLRVVLHDTKSALEQVCLSSHSHQYERSKTCALSKFSDRLGKLVDGVEHAKREIDRVSNSFTEGQDKVLEELNICGESSVNAESLRICASI